MLRLFGVEPKSEATSTFTLEEVQTIVDQSRREGVLDDLTGLHTGANTPYTRLSRAAAGCYDKLFWGCNLPPVTPPGERYVPRWRPDELADLRRVMRAGLDLWAAMAGPAVPSRSRGGPE